MRTRWSLKDTMADVTDRFDFAFLCGDLNFRLDITRLHADWLISRRGTFNRNPILLYSADD